MLKITLSHARKLLFVGAHSDDIEIGCGGTILSLLRFSPRLEILWVVFSAEGKRRSEARASAKHFLGGKGKSKVVIKDFRGSYFPVQMAEIKDDFESLKSFAPDVVFTHYRNDRHQDHRVLSDLTWNTFRNHLILEYEIPKYDGDLGAPNFFFAVPPPQAKRKAELIVKAFATQKDKHWFSEETFLSLMRLRGMECASHYAEGFYCRKLISE